MIPTSFDEFMNDPLFGIYLLCVVVILSVNFWLVVRPLNFLRIDYGMTVKKPEGQSRTRITKGIKELVSGPEKSTKKNMKVIRNYMLLQTVLILLPLMIVLAVRIMLGDPQKVDDWGISQILIPCVVFSIWVFWNGYRAYTFSEIIKPYLSRYQNWNEIKHRPGMVLAMISITNLSRRNLKKLSEIEVPEYIENEELDLQPMRIEDDLKEDGMKFNTEGIIENAGKIGKRISNSLKNTLTFGKEVAQGVSEQVTTKINNHVESKVKQWTKSNSIVGGFVENLAIVFIPIITIYCVPLI
jgi:hypothetical protein